MLRQHAPHAKSFVHTKAHRHRPLTEEERDRNRTKSKVRAKVEHVFLVIKRIFGWAKVRYRGLAKNTHWLQISCGLANLYMVRRRLVVGTWKTGAGGGPWAIRRRMCPTKRLSIQQMSTAFTLVVSPETAFRVNA